MNSWKMFLAGGAISISACATLRPAARASGPAVSPDGIELLLTRQSCERSRSPDELETYLIEETVELQVRSATPVEIRSDEFRLLTPHGASLRTLAWNSAEPITVKPSEPTTFSLRFMANGTRDCSDPVKLDPSFAFWRNGAPVTVGIITFTPTGAH